MASSRIKGITIEINGDTTKLSQSLSKVDKQISKTQTALRDVNKLLKMDPGNSDLLAQKQKYLSDSIDATKEKLEQERMALEQLKNAPGTEENIEAQERLQREIAATENSLQSLENEYENFGSVGAQQIANVGNQIKSVGDNMTKLGSSLTKNVTAPIVGVAVASGKAWSEVDAAMDTVVKKTGATGEALEGMQESVSNLASSIPTDFQTAADAVGEVNTRFKLTGDALEDLSKQFVQFSKLNDTDVSSSIDSVQAAMEAFNVEAEDAGKFLDLLNKEGQDTGVSVDKLADDMKTNSAALREMGFNASDSAIFLANLDKNGVDASTALTGLKAALKNSTKDGKTVRQALNALQKSMKGAKTETEAMQFAMEVFGDRSGAVLGKAIYEGKLSLDKLGTSLSDFEGNVSETFESTLSPADQFTMALNNMKEIGYELFNTIQEVGAPILQELSDTLRGLADKFKELSPETKQMIVKIAAIAAAVGPLLMVVGHLVSAFGSILTYAPKVVGIFSKLSSVLGGASGSAGALGGALGALPIIGIIAEIGLLIAAIKTAYDTDEQFRTSVNQAWTEISQSFAMIQQSFSELGQAIVDLLNSLGFDFENFSQVVKTAWEAISQAIANSQIVPILNTIKSAISLFATEVSTVFNGLAALLRGDWAAAWDYFGSAIKNIIETVVTYVAGRVPVIGGYLQSIIEMLFKLKNAESEAASAASSPARSSTKKYASAMNGGTILRGATIFGAQNGQYLQAGEAGPEVVVGANSLSSMIRSAVPQTDMTQLSSVISNAVGSALQSYGISIDVTADKDGLFKSIQQSNSQYKKMHGGLGALT